MIEYKLTQCWVKNEFKYTRLIEQRFPNGGVSVFQFKILNNKIPNFMSDWKDFLFSMFENISFNQALREGGIHTTNYDVIQKKKIQINTDGFSLITHLAKTLYEGGAYFSTLVDLKKYEGPVLTSFDAINISKDFIATVSTENIDELRVLSVYMTKWNNWFINAPFSDSYFIVHPKSSLITLIMITDTD